MTKKEMQAFRKKLLARREQVLEEMRQRGRNGLSDVQKNSDGGFTGYATHMADIGTDASEMEFMGNILSSEQRELFEIDEALLRIEEGAFGTCQSCRRPINKKRLEILPYAKYCKKHEEEKENPD